MAVLGRAAKLTSEALVDLGFHYSPWLAHVIGYDGQEYTTKNLGHIG
jgi:hypothetical protein